MADDLSPVVRLMYDEASNSFHRVDDFRAKLLGFLPLASGTLMSLLVGQDPKLHDAHVGVLGVFGALITLGLYCYELRGIQRCNILVRLGASIESDLGIRGPFTGKSTTPKIVHVIGATAAAFVIYPTVFAAWVFVAGLSYVPGHATVVGFLALLVLFIFSTILAASGQLDPTPS
jgi:hypothetical protein